MLLGEDGTREELARFERRELCAFFKGNHANASTVAAHGDHHLLIRYMLAPALLGVCLRRRTQELRASGKEPSRNVCVLPGHCERAMALIARIH